MKQGQRIKSPEELANAWGEFLEKKFEATDLERARADFEALPICTDEKDEITRAEFEYAVNKMKKNKSADVDGVAVEV